MRTILTDLKEVIDSLLECEKNNKKCRYCKLRKRGCLLFIRDSVAVALQFIANNMVSENPIQDIYI